jgi:D-3-phosphoglycerate dehydrogenase / 2-oxoglutarate reductase
MWLQHHTLGASTDEAQERAGIAVAVSVRKALSGELVPDAVNVKGGAIDQAVRPALPLVEKLAQVATALAGDQLVQLMLKFAVRSQHLMFQFYHPVR